MPSPLSEAKHKLKTEIWILEICQAFEFVKNRLHSYITSAMYCCRSDDKTTVILQATNFKF